MLDRRICDAIDESFRAILAGDEAAARDLLAKVRVLSCISKGGCPVRSCEADGECYLWRCAHPHAPKPESDAP